MFHPLPKQESTEQESWSQIRVCQEGERKTLDMGEVEAQQNEHHDTNVLHTWSQMGPPSAQHLGTYHNKDLGFKEPPCFEE